MYVRCLLQKTHQDIASIVDQNINMSVDTDSMLYRSIDLVLSPGDIEFKSRCAFLLEVLYARGISGCCDDLVTTLQDLVDIRSTKS